MTRTTLQILTAVWGLVAIIGLTAAVDDPGHVRSWGTFGTAVVLGVVLAVQWRRILSSSRDDM